MSLKKLGRYDLVRVLGRGAMGIVYEGRDPNLERRVAIKTVKVENLSEEAATEYEVRFRTEARSAARLQHPNIVSVYDSDRDGDIAFLVMEYIQGEDLKHYLDKGSRYSLEQSLKMIRDLLSALDYAHKQGVVHRDIKPANLLIEPGGRVKLTDFGVARIQNSGEATRTQGSMVGTLKYMSPEQVQGQKTDARADLFSVGVVLYQLLTDKRPFDGDNDFSIIHQIIGHTPPPPSTFNSRLPSAIDAVVARALAKDREQRFASARDFAAALQSAIRRAEDATIVPPADPLRKMDGAGSRPPRSATGTGNSPTSGSTVTQEIELVYWKDVRDSSDPEEVEGFLNKFPDGIYADLARRRLRKLSAATGSFSDTVLMGSDTPSGAEDLKATRQRAGSDPVPAPLPLPEAQRSADQTLPPGPAISPQAATDMAPIAATPALDAVRASSGAKLPGIAAQQEQPSEDFTNTVVEPREPQAPPAPAADPEATAIFLDPPDLSAALAASAADAPQPQPQSATGAAVAGTPARRRPLIAAVAAVAALAAVGVAALMMMDRGGVESAATATASRGSAPSPGVVAADHVAAVAAPTQAPAPAPVAAPAAPAETVPPAASAPPAESVAAARPAAPVARVAPARRTAATAKAQAEPPVAVETRREEPPPPPPKIEERRLAAAPQAAPTAPNPAEACRDKVFLSKEFCLAEQCEKPGARNHPLCVKRREEARLREESRVRN
ncbi:MAG: serine/threonine protein kinase [Ramlibacter sp.]|nr:serine/threonine protein kinase [Ramlibacter sp.]